ncbi:MAG: carboxypeptidase regulatory-like domain-containing protein [Thaumarchaeota archaeon]|nr:carboxypeptidase regulatory-like domain-containing protein [Nitrososphaerota archaeon]
MNKLASTAFIFILALSMIAVQSLVSAQAEATLVVKVVTPRGEPLKNFEVHLVKGAETRRFVTNSTGYADFKHLPPGEYRVEVKLGNITLAGETVKVPDQREITLTALIASVKLKLLNSDEKPVKGLVVSLRSETGSYNSTAESDEKGYASFSQVPYSELEQVGDYVLEVRKNSLTLYREDLKINDPEISKNIVLPLIDVNLTITNLEGEPVPKITVKLSSEAYTERKTSLNGTVSFESIPSSEVEGVGAYRINVTMRTAAGDLSIHSEKRAFKSSQSLSIVADLARLRVELIDDEGKPIKGAKIILSSDLSKNFTSAETNSKGVAEFRNIPLSFGEIKAGKYAVKAFRAGKLIGETECEVSDPVETVKLIAERKSVAIKITDFRGRPLANYAIKLIDEKSGEEFEAQTNDKGEAAFKLFYGAYDMQILKDEELVYSEPVQIKEETLDISLKSVNFPFTIIVLDAFENPVKSASVKILMENKTLLESKLNGEPLSIELPRPAHLYCDVYAPSGELIQRTSFYSSGPGVKEVKLGDFVDFNGLVPIENFAAIIAAGIAALSIIAFFAILYSRARAKG